MEELTPEQIEADKKQKFKDLSKYQVSKDWKRILDMYVKTSDCLLETIKYEMKNREKPELKYSEQDFLDVHVIRVEDLIQHIDDSEGGKIFKKYLQEQVDNSYTHLYKKVEIGFDAPTYSELDRLKHERNIVQSMAGKLTQLILINSENKEEKKDEHNPYAD